jgi:multidrug transporter EmrE-like cation transporter
MKLISCIIAYLFLSTVGLTLLKAGASSKHNITIIELAKNWQFILGFVCYALSFATWVYILSRKDLSFIYPIIIGLSYVAIMATSIFYLKEEISLSKVLGSLFIIVGIITITSQK